MLYGAAGAGLRAGRYGYGDRLIDGNGGDADDGRGLHSSTLRLNVSAPCGIGGVLRGCL